MTAREFELFVQEQQEPLRTFLLHLCRGDMMAADDLAQEAFVKAWLALDTFGGRSKGSTWLWRIAYNCYVDRARRESRHEAFDPAGRRFESIPATMPEKHEELYLAIEVLSETERTCVLLFYMEDRPLKEIAAITGMKINTIKSHLRRARTALRARMEELDNEKKYE